MFCVCVLTSISLQSSCAHWQTDVWGCAGEQAPPQLQPSHCQLSILGWGRPAVAMLTEVIMEAWALLFLTTRIHCINDNTPVLSLFGFLSPESVPWLLILFFLLLFLLIPVIFRSQRLLWHLSGMFATFTYLSFLVLMLHWSQNHWMIFVPITDSDSFFLLWSSDIYTDHPSATSPPPLHHLQCNLTLPTDCRTLRNSRKQMAFSLMWALPWLHANLACLHPPQYVLGSDQKEKGCRQNCGPRMIFLFCCAGFL